MARTKRGYIFATCFTSGIATVLCLVALGTQQWVTSEGEFHDSNFDKSKISYGLFTGTFERTLGVTTEFEISITCLVSDNVCAYLCQSSYDDRVTELENLYNDKNVTFNPSCPKVPKSSKQNRLWSEDENITPLPKAETNEREFISAGLYISTVIFLCIGSLFGILSTGLALWNTVGNPVETFLNIFGMYIYNGVACFTSVLTAVLWGALFGTRLTDNVCVLDTIVEFMTSADLANLGYSYWIIIPASLLYCTSIVLLFVRQTLINREPEVNIHLEETDDVGKIIIY